MSVTREDTEKQIKREHDSMDDFEHLEHDPDNNQQTGSSVTRQEEQKQQQPPAKAVAQESSEAAIASPANASDDDPLFAKREMDDPKKASLLLMEAEAGHHRPETETMNRESMLSFDPLADFTGSKPNDRPEPRSFVPPSAETVKGSSEPVKDIGTAEKPETAKQLDPKPEPEKRPHVEEQKVQERKEEDLIELSRPEPEEIGEIRSSVLPVPQQSPQIDFLGEQVAKEGKPDKSEENEWNVIEKHEEASRSSVPECKLSDRYEMSRDFAFGEGHGGQRQPVSAAESGESEFESEPEASPAKNMKPQPSAPPVATTIRERKPETRREQIEEIEIAPKEIFRSMGIDAWFNPDRLNPKVAALIYWRDPKKSGIVFGAILGVLLSLAYFSLISVIAHLSLFVLTGTVAYRIYKTVLQAVQKTSDGHPFKDILELELTVPAEKVHEVADVAVAHANAAVSELRRLFLVEDFVDSLKFGVLLWCLTYVGSWFNGMTLIIIGVVALFTLPKVYETNKAQIDQNLALVQGKINELTAKVKAAIPLGKKPEAVKEE